MTQTITHADVRRGWIDCQTCGDTLRIFYHQRCPTCHTQFTVPEKSSTQQEEQNNTSAENRADENNLSSASRRLQAAHEQNRCADVKVCTLSQYCHEKLLTPHQLLAT